jgi:uncharacterized protein (TIGR02996 family)
MTRWNDPDFRPHLDAILAAPDDDAPRLALADWLNALGNPLGEFTRTQCELDQLEPSGLWWRHVVPTEHDDQSGIYSPFSNGQSPVGPREQRHKLLRARELALFARHARDWVAPIRLAILEENGLNLLLPPDPTEAPFNPRAWFDAEFAGFPIQLRFARGLIEDAKLSVADFADWGEALLDEMPTIRQVVLQGVGVTDAQRLADCPALTRVESLDLSLGFAELGQNVYLNRLEAEEAQPFGDWLRAFAVEHGVTLADPPPPPHEDELTGELLKLWRSASAAERAAAALLESLTFCRVRKLNLTSPDTFALAVVAGLSAGLEAFRMDGVPFRSWFPGRDGLFAGRWARLLRETAFARLARLSVARVTTPVVEALAAASGLAQVQFLDIRSTAVEKPGVLRQMLEAPHWRSLRRIQFADLSREQETEILDAVAISPHLADLEVVDLGPGGSPGLGLPGETVARLAASPIVALLRALWLNSEPADPSRRGAEGDSIVPRGEDVAALLDNPALRGPIVLAGALTRSTEPQRWLNAPGAAKISYLRWNDVVGEAALAALASSPHLTGIRTFDGRWAAGWSPDYPTLAHEEAARNKWTAKTLAEGKPFEVYRMETAAARALASSSLRTTVEALDLSMAFGFSDDALRALIAVDWPRLQYLSLLQAAVTTEGIRALAAWPGLARLAFLEFGGDNDQFDAARAIAAIADSPYAANIEYLNCYTPGETKARALLRRLAALPKLRFCSLYQHLFVHDEDEGMQFDQQLAALVPGWLGGTMGGR